MPNTEPAPGLEPVEIDGATYYLDMDACPPNQLGTGTLAPDLERSELAKGTVYLADTGVVIAGKHRVYVAAARPLYEAWRDAELHARRLRRKLPHEAAPSIPCSSDSKLIAAA